MQTRVHPRKEQFTHSCARAPSAKWKMVEGKVRSLFVVVIFLIKAHKWGGKSSRMRRTVYSTYSTFFFFEKKKAYYNFKGFLA